MAEPTPRPWSTHEGSQGASVRLYAGGKRIGIVWNCNRGYRQHLRPSEDEGRANAALIVRAVNSFDDIVDVLSDILAFGHPSGAAELVIYRGLVDRARDALAKAKGETGG